MSRFLCLVTLLSAAVIAPAHSQATAQPADRSSRQRLDDLSGLWSARKWFGPEVRGQLIVERTPAGLVADVAGLRVLATRHGRDVEFELPGEQGVFSGSFEGTDAIRGHWIRAITAISYNRAASPVLLESIGPGRWAGTVDPGDEEFSFYIFAHRDADGSYQAVLRNPEFDLGNQQGARRLVRAADTVKLMAARGEGRERVLAAGPIEPEMDGFSLVFPGRGGSYDFRRDGDSSLVYPRPLTSAPYRYLAPPPLTDGWPTSTLPAEHIDRPAMERLVQSIIDMNMDEADAPEIHAQVYQVMHGGTFPAGLDSRKRAMTLENLLTMSSGHDCDDTDDKAPGNEDFINDELQPPNVIDYFMSVPMATDPGTNSVYCSMQPHLALSMLGEATHESPLRIFDRLVARPMRITHYSWPLDTNGRPYGGGGVAIRARDFMKFGQLMLNGGTWGSERILDADYAKAAVSPRYHLRNVYYGYLWWLEYYPYKGRELLGYSARGAGGNLVFVFPDLDLVVTTMAGNYSNRRGMRYLGNFVATSILPAVREAGDDPNAPVQDVEWTSAYGSSKDGSRVSGPILPDRKSTRGRGLGHSPQSPPGVDAPWRGVVERRAEGVLPSSLTPTRRVRASRCP